ncbi:unnamed protein product [Toxocara canis]|uniref:Uncharacterized protein n=1 Tax=Toxocara canis TaxID=6265 RepID=A0A183VDZ1_TOXCA|nr:unnamed protein product [Toxocara canis]
MSIRRPFYDGLRICSQANLMSMHIGHECYGVDQMDGIVCCCIKECPADLFEKFHTLGYSPAQIHHTQYSPPANSSLDQTDLLRQLQKKAAAFGL